MKRRGTTKSRINYDKTNDDKVIISSEYFEDDRPSYICSICNQGPLIRLTDSSMQNTAFWCRHCSVEFNPEEENVRRESKLSVPDRNSETLVSTTPGINEDSVAIRHEPEIKGGLKALKDKGLKITYYEEHIPK
jgi:uncharacterized Zn ribbon protein